MVRVTSPKDFWSGLIYVAIGAGALWFGSEYRMGTAGRMGPGYFPKVLAATLIAIGIIALIRSVILSGSSAGTIAWRPLFIVLLACAAFGLALPRFGLIVALLVLCLGSASASREFRFDPLATVGLLGLITFCSLVFVKGLGVPMPLLGSWLEPTLGPILPWLQ